MDTLTMEIKPWLAESWEFSPDMKQLKIHVRDNVYYHNGNKLTAEDFKFSIEDCEKMYPNRLGMNLDYVEVVDELTCIIHLTAPYGPILNWMSTRMFCILNKKYFEEVGGVQGYQDRPIGTGPFKFVNRIPGDKIVLERNDNYWGGPSQFKTVTIQTISDINTAILALQSGDIDILINPPIENLLMLNDRNVKWDAIDCTSFMSIKFCMLEKNWVQGDLNFRKAVQFAVDREAINEAVYAGRGEVIDSAGSKSFTARPPNGTYATYNKNLNKAREYLGNSTYKGQDFRVVARAGTNEAKTAEVVQGSLQEIGINMKIITVDSATYSELTNRTGDYDALAVTTGVSHLDYDGYYNQNNLGRNPFNPNWKGPRINEIDELCTATRREGDYDKRVAGWAEVTSIINEDAYWVFLVQEIDTLAWRQDRLLDPKMNRGRLYRCWEWMYH
jgi:peptide/nickel transport system substrate-binding protein